MHLLTDMRRQCALLRSLSCSCCRFGCACAHRLHPFLSPCLHLASNLKLDPQALVACLDSWMQWFDAQTLSGRAERQAAGAVTMMRMLNP